MTPTLIGRWQSRVMILGTVGVLVTLFFGAAIGDVGTPLAVLLLVVVLGLGWDVLYTFLQRLRWDQDWPPLLVLLSGIWEALVAWVLIPLIPGFPRPLAAHFVLHYALVWLAMYAMLFGGMRILFPHWRFNGGRVL